MKKIIIAYTIFLSSCTPIYLISKDDFKKIPTGSTKVIVKVPYSADSLMNTFTRVMASQGFPVNTNKIAMQVSSEGKSIGGGTMMKTLIYFEQIGDSSKATMTGAYGLDATGNIAFSAFAGHNSSGTDVAVFNGSSTSKPDLVYQQMVVFAKAIPDARIIYSK